MGFVNYEAQGAVGLVTINRPEALNALNPQVLADLKAVFEGIDQNAIRCVVVTGAGEKSFVAGADIGSMSVMTKAEGEAFGKMGKSRILRGIITAYVEIIRGTPSLLQVYVGYFVVPLLLPSLNVSTYASVAIALTINSSAYVSEVIRSGIQAVDKGQTEAARSLGLTRSQAMIKVVLPQAVKNILPALGNEFITIIKETSLASTFFVGDLMTSYLTVNGKEFLPLQCLLIVGIIYFILTFILGRGVSALERRLSHD